MKLNQLAEAGKLLNKKTPSLDALAKKHDVSKDVLKKQLAKGVKVELEHTSDKSVANEIALDHINEFPDYYDRLERAESE